MRQFAIADIARRPAGLAGPGWPGIVATALLATLLAPLNATMIVVALPQVVLQLGGGVAAGSLLITAYLFAMAVLPPLGGRLGDRWSRPALLLTGLAVFGLAALGAARAASLTELLAWRLCQAVGGALAFPNALGLVREFVPARRRGMSFGLIGSVMALSAAAGPPLGELMVAHGGWRAVFWINVPLVVLAVIVGAVTLGPLLRERRPWPQIRAESGRLGVAVILRNGGFMAAALAMGLTNLVLYSTLVGLPLALRESGRSRGPETGLLLMALMGTSALAAPAAGRFADSRGRRTVALVGLCLMAAGLLWMAVFGEAPGLQAMAGGLALVGVGLGASSTAIQTAGIEAVGAAESGLAAGVLSTSRYAGGAAGSALLLVVFWAAPLDPVTALFALGTAGALLALIVGARLGTNLAKVRS
jgi:DHA2 family methylenomycin A resistance protein-like MFS transporter